jgi:hypothetical protein
MIAACQQRFVEQKNSKQKDGRNVLSPPPAHTHTHTQQGNDRIGTATNKQTNNNGKRERERESRKTTQRNTRTDVVVDEGGAAELVAGREGVLGVFGRTGDAGPVHDPDLRLLQLQCCRWRRK